MSQLKCLVQKVKDGFFEKAWKKTKKWQIYQISRNSKTVHSELIDFSGSKSVIQSAITKSWSARENRADPRL